MPQSIVGDLVNPFMVCKMFQNIKSSSRVRKHQFPFLTILSIYNYSMHAARFFPWRVCVMSASVR